MSNLNGRKTKSLSDIPEVFNWRGHNEWKILLKVPLENEASERSKVLSEERKDIFIVPARKLEHVEQSNSEDEANEEEEGPKKAEAEKTSHSFKVIPKSSDHALDFLIFLFSSRSVRFSRRKPEETEENPLGDRQFSIARRNHADDHQFLERNVDLHGHSRRHVSSSTV